MPVDKVKVRRWVKALRSGKFKQSRNAFKTRNPDGTTSFCCLGVAGELGFGSSEERVCAVMGIADFPPPRIYAEQVLSMSGTLVSLNDEEHYRFPRIADWVEKHILGVKPTPKKKKAA